MFHDGKDWIKTKNTSNFDVPMGSFDSANIADIVGLYILDNLKGTADINTTGLYRDDGLMIIPKSNGPKSNKMHKKYCKNFQKHRV